MEPKFKLGDKVVWAKDESHRTKTEYEIVHISYDNLSVLYRLRSYAGQEFYFPEDQLILTNNKKYNSKFHEGDKVKFTWGSGFKDKKGIVKRVYFTIDGTPRYSVLAMHDNIVMVWSESDLLPWNQVGGDYYPIFNPGDKVVFKKNPHTVYDILGCQHNIGHYDPRKIEYFIAAYADSFTGDKLVLYKNGGPKFKVGERVSKKTTVEYSVVRYINLVVQDIKWENEKYWYKLDIFGGENDWYDEQLINKNIYEKVEPKFKFGDRIKFLKGVYKDKMGIIVKAYSFNGAYRIYVPCEDRFGVWREKFIALWDDKNLKPKFKIGDMVKVLAGHRIGEVGNIEKIYMPDGSSEFYYTVRINDKSCTIGMSDRELTLFSSMGFKFKVGDIVLAFFYKEGDTRMCEVIDGYINGDEENVYALNILNKGTDPVYVHETCLKLKQKDVDYFNESTIIHFQ